MQIVFIGGTGRSGSTLVERVLDQDEGVFAVGELESLLFRPDSVSSVCGCGEPVGRCEVWHAVLTEAFGGIAQFESADLPTLRTRVLRTRHLPLLISGIHPAGYTRDLSTLTDAVRRVYRAVFAVTGTGRVVDASKVPAYAHVVARTPDVDLRVIHLVRDARGVAYSMAKSGFHRPQTGEDMPTFSPSFIATGWVIDQALLATLPGARRVVLRYEDLAREGSSALSDRLEQLGLGDIAVPAFTVNQTLPLRAGHGLYGNPMRFERAVTLRVDEEWRSRFRGRGRLATTALAAPALARYGYLGRRREVS